MTWPTVPLRDLAIADGQYGLGAASRELRDGDPRYVRITDIRDDGTLQPNAVAPDCDSHEWRKSLLRQGDLLFARSGATVGKTYLHPADVSPTVYAGYLIRFQIDTARALPKYIFHFTKSATYRAWVASAQHTVAQPNINAKQYAALPVPIPPLKEQRRIAAILDQAESVGDLFRRRTTLFSALARATYVAMFGDPFENERRWPTMRVDQIGRVQLGRQRAPKYQTGKHSRPYLRVANVYENRLDLSDVLSMDFDEKDFLEYRLKPGDILLNEGQSTELVGRPAMFRGEVDNCCFQNTLLRVQVDETAVLPEFALGTFLNFFRMGRFARLSSKTSSVAHLGKSRLSSMQFPLPPLSLQSQYRESVAQLDSLRNTETPALCTSLAASLQSRAFRGEL